MSHGNFECLVKTDGPYIRTILATLKSPPIPTLPTPQTSGTPTNEDSLYGCLHCVEVADSIDKLKKHVFECHQGVGFTYKLVTKAKVEVMYCCSYCHERGSDKFLEEHHKEKHKNLKFNIYQYICLECSGTFINIKHLRKHFSETHLGKKLTYSCVENKKSDSKEQYSCTKCPFRSCTVGGIRAHVRKHLRPFDCLLCGSTFIYPTEARVHHSKEHPNDSESIEENRDRLKEYETMVSAIVAAKESPKSPVKRMLARKSTGAPFVKREESV